MKRNTSSVETENILEELSGYCTCNIENVTSCIHEFSIINIKNARIIYKNKTKQQQLQWIIDIFIQWYNRSNGILSLWIEGKKVCMWSFLDYHGISCYQYYEALYRVKNKSDLQVIHGNYLRDYKDTLSRTCRKWLNEYCEKYGDKQPDSNNIYTPINIYKRDLYVEFLNEYPNDEHPSLKLFLRICRKEFSLLKIPKHWMLGKCDICVELDGKRSRCKTPNKVKLWKDQVRDHKQLISRERDANTYRIAEAKNSSGTISLIGIDRMAAIYLPHQVPFPKSWMISNQIRYEVIGCFDAVKEDKQIWHGLDVFDHDSDVTMTIIF